MKSSFLNIFFWTIALATVKKIGKSRKRFALIRWHVIFGLLAIWYPCVALSEAAPYRPPYEADGAFSYRAGKSDSLTVARAIALYEAKYKSVITLVGRLSEAKLIKPPGAERREMMCLLAEALTYRLTEESFDPKKRIYSVTLTGTLSLDDLVRVENMNEALARQESHFTLREEMEPALLPEIAIGRELSRAYRYIRKNRWRMAVIYLDHLERKYPHWGGIFFAKAMAFRGMHETERALTYLAKACHAGTQEACDKLTPSNRRN